MIGQNILSVEFNIGYNIVNSTKADFPYQETAKILSNAVRIWRGVSTFFRSWKEKEAFRVKIIVSAEFNVRYL